MAALSNHTIFFVRKTSCFCSVWISIFSLLLQIIFIQNLSGQDNLYFENVSNTGLFTPVTRVLASDAQGYLYIGTNDGFYKYDGFAFSKYPSAAVGNLACPILNVRVLCFDGSNIWLGGSEGLAKMDVASNTFTMVNVGLPDEFKTRITVRSIKKVSDNIICVASYAGIALIDIKSNQVKYLPLPGNDFSGEFSYVSSIDTDANGNVWIGTQRNGLFVLNINSNEILSAKDFLPSLKNLPGTIIHEVLNYTQQSMLVATELGIYTMNVNTGIWQALLDSDSEFSKLNPDVRNIVRMHDSENLLIVTHGEGLFYFIAEKKYVQHYTYNERWNNGLKENYLNDVIDGGNGIYWIATENAGIIKMDTWFSRYRFVLIPELQNDNYVLSVNDLHKVDQDYWLATSSGLLQYHPGNGFSYHNASPLYDKPYLQNMHRLNNDLLIFQIWFEGVGTFNLTTKKFGFLQMPGQQWEGNSANFDWLSFVEDEQNYYLADFDGNYFRCNYERNTIDTLFTATEVSLSLPVVIPQTHEELWIISASGLYTYNTTTKKLNHIVEDAQQNKIPPVSFQEDIIVRKNGMVYIASDEGFFEFDRNKNQLIHFTTTDGLPSNNCFSLFESPDGEINIMFSDGIAEFDQKTKEFFYTPLPKLVASSPTPFYGDDNYFYLGADNCFIQVHTDSIVSYSGKSILRILSITAGKKNFPVHDFSDPFIIHYNDFPIVITYEVIDYMDAARNRIQYTLTGWDADFIGDKSRSLKAMYSKLTAGEYAFILKSSSPVSNQTAIIQIPFIVKSPYWQTWWFIGIVVILLLAIPYGIYRYRLDELLRMQNLRNKIALDLHDEVGSSLSSIHMLSAMAVTQENNKDILRKISGNAGEIVEKMNDIIWMINPKYDQTSDIIKKLDKYLQQVCIAKNITYDFKYEGMEQLTFTMQERKNIFLIMKEGINNAAKYSGTNTLHVSMQKISNKVRIVIQDFGKGFDLETIQPGNGLDSIRLRANELKAKLEIKTELHKGTMLEIIFTIRT